MTTIREIATSVKAIRDEDYTPAREKAAKAFFEEIERRWPEEFGEPSEFFSWAKDATYDEMIDEVIARLGDRADDPATTA